MGKDSVITFKISVISAAGGVEGVSSAASVIFGSGLSAFLFFEAAAFGSRVDFLFFKAFFILLYHSSSLPTQNTDNSLSFHTFGTFIKPFIIRILKFQDIHHPVQPLFGSGAEGCGHQLVFLFGIISKYFITHYLDHIQPLFFVSFIFGIPQPLDVGYVRLARYSAPGPWY
jgi:hypothetical protein